MPPLTLQTKGALGIPSLPLAPCCDSSWGQAVPRQCHPCPTAASSNAGAGDVQTAAWLPTAHPPVASHPPPCPSWHQRWKQKWHQPHQPQPGTGSGAQLALQPHNHGLEEMQVTLEVALAAQPLGTDDDKGSAHCTPALSGAWEG